MLILLDPAAEAAEPGPLTWKLARARGRVFEESGRNASRLLKGWYKFKRDPDTSLYSRSGVWDYHNEAADHYGSLVLVAYFVDTPAIAPGGILHETLRRSMELCSTPSGIPAPYDTVKKVKLDPGPGREGELVYGAAEWCKDGLNRIVETLGPDNGWYGHLESVTQALMRWSDGKPISGGLPAKVKRDEVHGNLLQTLPRLYANSGNEDYLRWAEAIADSYLLNDPVALIGKTTFSDHGGEMFGGLGELFALECQLGRPKRLESITHPCGDCSTPNPSVRVRVTENLVREADVLKVAHGRKPWERGTRIPGSPGRGEGEWKQPSMFCKIE